MSKKIQAAILGAAADRRGSHAGLQPPGGLHLKGRAFDAAFEGEESNVYFTGWLKNSKR